MGAPSHQLIESFRQSLSNFCKMIYLSSLETPLTVTRWQGEDFESQIEELQRSQVKLLGKSVAELQTKQKFSDNNS